MQSHQQFEGVYCAKNFVLTKGYHALGEDGSGIFKRQEKLSEKLHSGLALVLPEPEEHRCAKRKRARD
ncbi:hypothetical protein [Leisingera sp. ANG-M1]|uniref:hypothetical protein n=1 Tax=Leisingera sp. ANG-M1 TaxID=1577895 RepID=UPI001269C2A6|nr:hypothetical protein [Leisingera sp. ANG-M1]